MAKNHSLFENWTEKSAYAFGFWLTDGSIYIKAYKDRPKYYQKMFVLYNTDKQIMVTLSALLGQKLHTDNRHSICYSIRIGSDKLFDFCYNITGTTYKSHGEWAFPRIGKHQRHLIRGFFDGDGSIYYKTYKNRHGKITRALATSFTAYKHSNILSDLRNILEKNLGGLGHKKIVVSKNNSKLSFNQYDSMLLCEWMYKNATIFMKRKKNIWDNTDKAKLLRSRKYFSKSLAENRFA